MCQVCRSERGHSGTSAWTRTEFYSRPFRVLQFDTITCNGDEGGSRYVLTCVCVFSRWCWLVPVARKDAVSIANGPVHHVMLPMALFPSVWRSDNAREFWSEIVRDVIRLLGARHIGLSTYHPQSQGAVEPLTKM